jgi:mannose-6-phosphate isomerase-like protein (cupin superfamily)
MNSNLTADFASGSASGVLETGQGRCFWFMGDFYAIKTTPEQTGGAYSVVEVESFPGNGPPPHIHHREDECFYVVEGAFSVILGGKILDIADGDFIRIPKGTPHTYKNVGAIPGKLLVVFSPGGFEQLFAEVGKQGTREEAHREDDLTTLNRFLSLANKYQLEICS